MSVDDLTASRTCERSQRKYPEQDEMWNTLNDNDILDFALLWDPLGGPSPENVSNAFSIDMSEYNYRLRGAARSQLTQIEQGTTSPGHIYGVSALAALARDSQQCAA